MSMRGIFCPGLKIWIQINKICNMYGNDISYPGSGFCFYGSGSFFTECWIQTQIRGIINRILSRDFNLISIIHPTRNFMKNKLDKK